MKKRTNLLTVFALSTCFMFSCCKDDTTVTPANPPVENNESSSVELRFDSRYGSEDFSLDKTFNTANNDQIKFARVGYYISNVELVKADGSTFKEPNSYHLIWMEDAVENETFKIKNVPADNYTKIRFLVGIDSVQNAQVPGSGDLSPDNHMSWMWTTSYIFFHSKGFYQKAGTTSPQEIFNYDIGHNYSRRQVELTLPSTTRIDGNHATKVNIYSDLKAQFGGPNVIDIKTTPNLIGGPQDAATSKLVADNYATMFKIQDVTN